MPALAIPRHRRARPLTTMAIILALGGTGAACDRGHGDWSERSVSPALTCGRAAPDGGTVEVVEEGFSNVNNSDEDPEVSYGLVLENTSTTHLATLTLVVAHLTDADSNEANDIIKDPTSPPAQAVHSIFPGQRIGIGEQVALDLGPIEEFTVEVGASSWVPIEQAHDIGEATVIDIDFQWTGTASNSTAARIGFKVMPTADPRQSGTGSLSISDAQTWAIFRDADGAIVGGGSGPPGTSWNGVTDSYPITGFVGVSRVPDGAVETGTEIYVSPFYPPYAFRPC